MLLWGALLPVFPVDPCKKSVRGFPLLRKGVFAYVFGRVFDF